MKSNTAGYLVIIASAAIALATVLQHLDVGQLPWFAARASGLVAYAAMTGSVVLGLCLSDKAMPRRFSRSFLYEMHQFLSVLSLVFIGVHAAALLADGYMKLNLIDLVLPGAVAYERTWTAVGVAGAWLLAAIALSWPIRGTIGRKAWRTLHYFTFVGWLMSLMHGIGAGTDIEVPAVYWGYVLSASTVAALLVYRIADARRRHATPARTASARAKRVQTT